MGRKGCWFSSIKKPLGSKEKKAKKENKSNKRSCGNEKPPVLDSPDAETVEVSHYHPPPVFEDVKLTEVESEQKGNAYQGAVATAAEAQVTKEFVQPAKKIQFAGKSKDEVAAIRIQTAFRGYLARRALRALRGLVRLKSLVDGPIATRQTSNTLKCMQTLSRVHSQIQSRRIRMLEENQALQRQLLQKRARELESLKLAEEWDDSVQSKEQIEANLLHKYEAAMRRERALAYSYTHQQTWKKSAKPTNLLFMDPTNPHWGWSWLERWMAARPWEPQATSEKDPDSNKLSVKSASAGEITKSFARHQLNSDNPSPPTSHKPPPSHPSRITPLPRKGTPSSLAARKLKTASPKVSAISQDDDSRSIVSMQSERKRRHSIGGSSVRDDESLASSTFTPSYMAPTSSAKAKSRLSSPLGTESGENGGMPPDKESVGSTKKRISYPPSPARPRRHSGPPRVETSSIVENGVNGVVS